MNDISPNDEYWMSLAIEQAQQALSLGEVPVGAVIVHHDKCIAAAHNTPITSCDPSAHAEINALRLAAQKLKNYRLDECTVYVTLEPCAMCAMAMLHARVKRIVYGASEPKTGAAGSVIDLFANPQMNHQTTLTCGALEKECGNLLKNFFSEKRHSQKENKISLRDDALRTPESRFSKMNIPEGEYISTLPALNGLRLHYHLLSTKPLQPFYLLIHDAQSYSEPYRQYVAKHLSQGQGNFLIPDLIGFGRSDKPKKEPIHTAQFHAQVLYELLCSLHAPDDVNIVLPATLSPLVLPLALIMQGRAGEEANKKRIGQINRKINFHFYLIQQLPALNPVLADLPYVDKGYHTAVKALERWRTQPANAFDQSIDIQYHDDLEHCLQKTLNS